MNKSAVSNISKEQQALISDLFKTMNESSAPNPGRELAKIWLEDIGSFTGFVNGEWIPSTDTTPDSTTDLQLGSGLKASIRWTSPDKLNKIVENSREGLKNWHNYQEKSKVLYRISQCINQKTKLINEIESLTKYGRFREKCNVNYLKDSFDYYAGLLSDEEFSKEWKPTGVVCIVCRSERLVSTLWTISALLAAGNAVICLIDCIGNLSTFFLAQLFLFAGLPTGVFNVVPYNASSLPDSLNVDKIILSSSDSHAILSETFNKNIPYEVIPQHWPNVIIYESSDLDAAISNILEMVHIFDFEKPYPMCKIYLEESIRKEFIKILTLKVCGSLRGNAKSRPFYLMGKEVTIAQVHNQLSALSTDGCLKDSFIVSNCSTKEDENQLISSTVISFGSAPDKIKNIRDGPGLYIELFRTVKESLDMFNRNKYNSDVSIWSEEIYLSLEVASKFKCRIVWVNCQNTYEPSVTNGSLYLSGNSNIGGKEGLISHLLCTKKYELNADSKEMQSYGSQAPPSCIIPINNIEEKRSVKLYIGGSFINSSGETFQKVLDAKKEIYAFVASANMSDIDKAVTSASSSQPKWKSMLKIKRAAVLRNASEMLNKKREEFVSELHMLTGQAKEFCSIEVDQAVSVLLYWANYIAKLDGKVLETNFCGKVFLEYQPLGVIGIQCPDNEPLLSFAFLIAPAIAFGNAVVAIASEKYPTCALKMCEVFQAVGLLGGVLNVVSSSRSYLTRHLSSHLNVDAIWFTEDGAAFIHDSYHTIQPKKIFNCKNMPNTLDKVKTSKFLLESNYTKAIFVPMGTGFA